jgi:signal transduction histidine kinase
MANDIQRLVEELRHVPPIADLPEHDLIWLASNLTERTFPAGAILAQKGGPADSFHIVLEGEFQLRFESDPHDTRVYPSRAGEIVGKLPYSRLTHWPGTFRSNTPGRILTGSTDLFPEMTREVPQVVQRMVAIMSDRIRYTTREDQQGEKMAALGKLSAGLAHELNNPAASAKRAAQSLTEAQEALREATSRLDHRELTSEQRHAITTFERQALHHTQAPVLLDSLTQSEQEDEINAWLKKQNLPEGWKLSPVLAENSLDVSWLESLQQKIGTEAFPDALSRIVAQVLARKLTKEIESSTNRISELVRAIKEYSYMDQAPIQQVDLHKGIENTLVMLRYKLKHGIEIEKKFDPDLPAICAYGSELNQVWTNLIDNAADAMKKGGKLTIRTCVDRDCAVIDICDTGLGVPKDIEHKIFEPFFTTKKMGEGTGLGLDTVYRIVRKHNGSIRVDSKPGDTRFQVRLPIKQ